MIAVMKSLQCPLHSIALIALGLFLNRPAVAQEVSAAYLALGPLLGEVGPAQARVWAKASGPAALAIQIGLKETLSDGWQVKGPQLLTSNDFVGQVLISKLQPSQRYYYRLLLDGAPAMLPPYPSFVTAPPDGEKGRVRVAFCSCVGNHGYDSAGTWGDIALRTNFDLLLMLGDNHYANSTDPTVLGRYFGVQRRIAGYAEISRRVPQYAIWDNHDYGPEPCDKTAKDKARALQVFKEFWPNPAFGEPDNPGVYFKFSHGSIDFFMTDDRYDRTPNDAPEDGTKSLLGAKQLAWLKRELLASKAPVKIIASGGEFQTHGQKNSWTSFLRERNDLLQFIEDHGITGVLLISGDRHFTAAYQVMGKFIEVTSGPLGSANADTKPTPEMFYYGGKGGKFYCIFDIDTERPDPKVVLEIYRASEGLVQRREFTWDEVLGQSKIKTLPLSPAKPEAAKADTAKPKVETKQ
jgi:alkaline phosphatase D